ncbi:MAG: C/D box methylation guide ribonucleoprotein complex aNOP56 subunit, partial [Candidatus Thorarchaeota archaeon]
ACRERDLLVKQAINAVDDLNKSINIITMRAKEWYSFHSPSVSMIVDDPEVLSQIITGEYDHTELESRLAELGHPTTIFESLSKSELNRIGGALSETDIEAIRSLGKLIGVLLQVKRGLEHYVELMMREVAPNLSALVEPLVAARLIDGAGSLADLARRPSSTVQVLGAERALFRSLRTGTAPPKHGLIFQLPEVHSAPLWQRGRIARAFAGKIAIAARVDAYSKRDVSEQLRQDLERRLIEIRNRSRPRLTHATTTRSRPSTEKGTRTGRRKAPRKRGGRNN